LHESLLNHVVSVCGVPADIHEIVSERSMVALNDGFKGLLVPELAPV
jgi:hypothetical protein